MERLCSRFKKDAGKYRQGEEVRLDADVAASYIGSGCAVRVDAFGKKDYGAAPENKMASANPGAKKKAVKK